MTGEKTICGRPIVSIQRGSSRRRRSRCRIPRWSACCDRRTASSSARPKRRLPPKAIRARSSTCARSVSDPNLTVTSWLRNTVRTCSTVHDLFCSASRFGAEIAGNAMLTKKQHELLRFIHERLKEQGVPPSFDEMKDALDLRSKSGIHRLIMALEERGFIRRLPNRARALEVVRMPEASIPGVGVAQVQRGFRPNVIEGNLGRARPTAPGIEDDAGRPVLIPVMGRIA